MRRHVVPVVLLIVLAVAAVAPIGSYDFFWHLATGRWIVEHRALPLTDPFAVASDRVPWINGEWLFEVATYFVWRIGGFSGVAVTRALVVGALFAIAFAVARRSSGEWTALALTTLAFAAAHARLDARPLTFAALFVALAIALLEKNDRGRAAAYVILTIVWMNVHPSALLAPVIAAAAQLRTPRTLWLPFASAAALLVNPFGWRAIAAPIELTAFAQSGAFVNAEWLPSDPRAFPLLYASLVAGIAAFAAAADKREHFWRMVLFAMFAVLAVRHVRHQPLYLAAFPLLVAPAVPRKLDSKAWIAIAALPVIWVAWRTDHRPTVDARRFPVAAVERLRQSGLHGNIYNPDQFGGFLIWSFYPERRALTDGRNELYHSFIGEYAAARLDGRAWAALLRRYRIDLAVDEYRPPLETIDAVTRTRTVVPASLAYFPRRDWALLAWDDAGMVFARRAAFPPDAIARWEIRRVVPDAR